jgi:hypothetical protein
MVGAVRWQLGVTMEYAIVPLEAPDTDWANLVRFVERSGQPLWLEAEGEVRGVLLPIARVRRLMAQLAGEQTGELASSDECEEARVLRAPSHI